MSSQFDELFKTVNKKKRTPKKREGTARSSPPTPHPGEIKNEIKTVSKSRNSEYTQALVYIKKETKKSIKKALIDDIEERNFSDLVEELLLQWLKT